MENHYSEHLRRPSHTSSSVKQLPSVPQSQQLFSVQWWNFLKNIHCLKGNREKKKIRQPQVLLFQFVCLGIFNFSSISSHFKELITPIGFFWNDNKHYEWYSLKMWSTTWMLSSTPNTKHRWAIHYIWWPWEATGNRLETFQSSSSHFHQVFRWKPLNWKVLHISALEMKPDFCVCFKPRGIPMGSLSEKLIRINAHKSWQAWLN